MKMRTVCKTVFKFEELMPEAREKAIQNFSLGIEYPSYDELDETLRSFQDLFNVTIKEYNVGYTVRPYIRYYLNEDVPQFDNPIRLRTWIINNYSDGLFRGKYYGKLKGIPGNYRHIKRYSKVQREKYAPTGYYLDYTITEALHSFLKHPYHTTWENLIDKCLMDCLHNVENDIHYFFSEERISEAIIINDIEFYETGEMY